MLLSDAETLLGITMVGTSEESMYQARFEAAKDDAKTYCNDDFLVEQDDGTYKEVIPKGAQMGISLILLSMSEDKNTQSKSLSGAMSESYFENGTYKSGLYYLKPYRKAGFK